MRRLALGTLLLAALSGPALAGCGGGATSTTVALPPGCRPVPRPPPKHVHLKRPHLKVASGARLTATVDTSCGSFRIALDAARSPKTVSSFVYLARKGVYDDTIVHRIVPRFVVQGGDPTETGAGGPGYSVNEPPPASTQYTKRTVAMAKTPAEPPGRSGSQFFVVTATDAGLPPAYAVLGRIESGGAVLKRIERLGDPASGQAGTPLATVVIHRITVGGS
ncbi:MAG TPA: peptidylprolyl isomerase [Solirubrobacterales bacterium]|nr:peptidylprolyl isomerase [Solirubrobacterales bacterium]